MVYVVNSKNKALMPCTPVIARLLLKDNKAKCIKRVPFTIKLLSETTQYTQSLTLGVDTGSGKLGSAVIDNSGNVIYLSEAEVRNDITKKMTKRSSYRRTRRSRKTRYRKPRWLNRANSIKKGRFSPTMTSKINSHLKEINYIKSILPITNIILETGTFDPHALKNPEVLKNKWLYQKGVNYGFANSREFSLSRDKYICQNCKGKSKDKRLEVHHIIYKQNGGSDDVDNLITLCKTCHDKVHHKALKLVGGKRKGNLSHATQMNSIRTQLLRRLPEAIETFGFITKEHRWLLSLPKEHYIDAVVIASGGNPVTFKINTVLLKKCISKGDYQQTKGVRSEKVIPTGKIQGFRKFDKVKYLGEEYFIKGRMSSGYAVLMDIEGNKIDFQDAPKGMKIAKLANLKRLEARKSWIIQAKAIPSIY